MLDRNTEYTVQRGLQSLVVKEQDEMGERKEEADSAGESCMGRRQKAVCTPAGSTQVLEGGYRGKETEMSLTLK